MAQSITPSCINECMSCKISTTPVAGMLGTMFVGSDRYTVVCLEVTSRTKCKVLTHFPDEYLKNRYTKDSVEYIPEDDLKALINAVTPNISWYEPYKDRMTIDEIAQMLDWELKRFNDSLPYSLRKNGRWMPKGTGAWGNCSVHWGYGDEYRDPSF